MILTQHLNYLLVPWYQALAGYANGQGQPLER